ncbi:RidA family protein [Candidatus Deianiraea vastatrix]|uniref:Endoribonuclease n=1 Tax=Candidatus Deianiraea vastatrix TaxID=2163644 RepID=A0A5B8XCW3_9RICK|nr:RidA family protein [Candidatus Deianiraea vastatrix]QED23162.1 Putative endoribonuclease [Candidatus Deianiraea vastatrix]
MSLIVENLEKLGLKLPDAVLPVANYVPCNLSNGVLYVSGQLPKTENGFITGQLGKNVSIEDGKKAAEICVLHALSQVKKNISDLAKIKKCIKITVLVNSASDFDQHSIVANGASDLLVSLLGENGKHARSAFGVSSLPFGCAVEVEFMFEIG